jgi:hypothetical protein
VGGRQRLLHRLRPGRCLDLMEAISTGPAAWHGR